MYACIHTYTHTHTHLPTLVLDMKAHDDFVRSVRDVARKLRQYLYSCVCTGKASKACLCVMGSTPETRTRIGTLPASLYSPA